MESYLALIYAFAATFVPKGFMACNGAILSISQNQVLFSLLGTNFGGNGQSTFGLPNLQGRTIVGTGNSSLGSLYQLGNQGGVETTTLTIAQMPQHVHRIDLTKLQLSIPASNAAGTSSTPGPTMVPAALPTIGAGPNSLPIKGYSDATPNTNLLPIKGTGQMFTDVTGSQQPLYVQSPYLALIYIIVTEGIYPSRAD